MFKGIRRRMIAYYLVVIAVIVVLMGALFVWFLNYFYMQTLRENLYTQARLAAALIEEMADNGAYPEKFDILSKNLSSELGLRFTLVDNDGLVLADSSENPALMENHANRPEIIEALEKEKGEAVRYSVTLDEQMFYLAVPLRISFSGDNTDSPAVIRLALPLAAINQAIFNLMLYIIGALLLSSIAALAAAIIISSRITGPIQKISKASKAIANGDYYPDLAIEGNDELADLAVNISEMGQTMDRRIEQVLFEKNKLETVVSSMSSGIIFVDSDLKIELINPAAEALFEVSRNQVTGSPVQNIVRYYALYENLKIVNRDGKSRLMEMNLYYPRNVILETYILPVSGAENRISGILLLFHEVTLQRSLEKMRSDFVANVSHELRTPLTSIRGYAETIMNEKLSEQQLLEFLQIIDREAGRLSNLLDDLLDLSQIENEKSFVKKEIVSMASVIEEAIRRVEGSRKKKSFLIEQLKSDPTLRVMGNHEWLCQALVNILENSIRHGFSGGKVMIKTSLKDKNVVTEITDNGPGIPKADLPYLFERFYRVDKARSRKSGSTGLGLSIVKHIMEAHGAKYTLESRENLGTTFRFTLPLAEELS